MNQHNGCVERQRPSAVEASEAILEALREDLANDGDWISENVPDVFALIGPQALPERGGG